MFFYSLDYAVYSVKIGLNPASVTYTSVGATVKPDGRQMPEPERIKSQSNTIKDKRKRVIVTPYAPGRDSKTEIRGKTE